MKQGILLIAIGHPYFGRMAYNLAITLKAASPAIPVAVIHDSTGLSHLSEAQQQIFDKRIPSPLPEGDMTAAMRLRLMLPRLTPFSETLSLDVDMAWLGGPVESLYELLADRDFTCVNEGYVDLDTGKDHGTRGFAGWIDPMALKEPYNLSGRFYQIRGEFWLFRKSKAVTGLFASARRIREKPLVSPATLGGAVTEEFAMNVAIAQAGMVPHADGWQPTYWPHIHGGLVPTISEMRKRGYHALSAGGAVSTVALKHTYNLIMAAACQKLGLPHLFMLQSKRDYLTARRFA